MKFSMWDSEEDERLRRLREENGLGWPVIATYFEGRTAAACQIRYYKFLRTSETPDRRPGPKPRLPAVSWRNRGAALPGVVPPPPAPAAAPLPPKPIRPIPVSGNRGPYLEALRERAELHLRIAERGLTGGVFGDPPPGRSALDERTQGRAAPLQPSLPGGGSDVR